MEINNPHNRVSAEQVLTDNGFTIISSFLNDGIYKKGSDSYKFDHPVWNGNKVRLTKIKQK